MILSKISFSEYFITGIAVFFGWAMLVLTLFREKNTVAGSEDGIAKNLFKNGKSDLSEDEKKELQSSISDSISVSKEEILKIKNILPEEYKNPQQAIPDQPINPQKSSTEETDNTGETREIEKKEDSNESIPPLSEYSDRSDDLDALYEPIETFEHTELIQNKLKNKWIVYFEGFKKRSLEEQQSIKNQAETIFKKVVAKQKEVVATFSESDKNTLLFQKLTAFETIATSGFITEEEQLILSTITINVDNNFIN